MTVTAACGGGGGGGTALYDSDIARFAADVGLIDALDYTDLDAAAMTGSYTYSGRTSFNMIANAGSITETQVEDWLSDLTEEDFTKAPALVATMDLTANFTNRTVGGRIHDFRNPQNGLVAGNLSLREGTITDGYFHYTAALHGPFGAADEAVEGLVVGDFMGDRAQMTLGAIGFGAGSDAYVGVYAGAR